MSAFKFLSFDELQTTFYESTLKKIFAKHRLEFDEKENGRSKNIETISKLPAHRRAQMEKINHAIHLMNNDLVEGKSIFGGELGLEEELSDEEKSKIVTVAMYLVREEITKEWQYRYTPEIITSPENSVAYVSLRVNIGETPENELDEASLKEALKLYDAIMKPALHAAIEAGVKLKKPFWFAETTSVTNLVNKNILDITKNAIQDEKKNKLKNTFDFNIEKASSYFKLFDADKIGTQQAVDEDKVEEKKLSMSRN